MSRIRPSNGTDPVLSDFCETDIIPQELLGANVRRGKYQLVHEVPELNAETIEWLNENLQGDWEFTYKGRLRFTHEQDSVLFKLRWIGGF